MCILVLEDEAVIRQVLAAVLEESGWPVCEAGCLAEADDCLTDDGMRVIIADRNLGGGEDGHEFAAAARTRRPELSVIYTSGRHDSLAGRNLREREWVLPKPYLPSHVADMVREALDA